MVFEQIFVKTDTENSEEHASKSHVTTIEQLKFIFLPKYGLQ